MITLKSEPSRLDLVNELSLDNLLCGVIRNRHGDNVSYSRSSSELMISDKIGHAVLDTSQLIYYPVLCDLLRKLKPYPVYRVIINLNTLSTLHKCGIQYTLDSLKQLNNLLEEHREKKAKLDAKVNNLIMLFGQNKTMPIYQGSKIYHSPKEYGYYRNKCRIIRISNISYFNRLPEGKHRHKSCLYELSAYNLLKEKLEANRKNYQEYHDEDFQHIKGFIGGIINTPILIFRCAKRYELRGKPFYLDFWTHQLVKTLSEARKLAQQYAGNNYYIDIFEE